MKVFISPHNDDETLFGAFTLQRERPLVVVVFDGHIQGKRGLPITPWLRRLETLRACQELGVGVTFLGFRDDEEAPGSWYVRDRLVKMALDPISVRIDEVEQFYLPAFETKGHNHHNYLSGVLEGGGFEARITHYLTYTEAGKSTSGKEVPISDPGWITHKLKALACYKSQLIAATGCAPHFLRDQREYYAG